MSKIHRNAALTIRQRKMVQELYEEGHSISSLSRRFGVNRKTIERWAKRDHVEDIPSGPKNPRRVVTSAYKAAVITHRRTHPDHGPITIAFHLKGEFPFANRGTIQQILQAEGLSGKRKNRPKSEKN